MRVIFDTNICVDHLRGFRPATDYLFRCQDMERWISSITVMELYAAQHITVEQQEKMARLFDGLNGIVEVDMDIARKAGEFLGKYRKDPGLNPIDALIAATALHLDAVLATRNKKHFDFIPGIVVDCPY
ncbi:type II toxin-antitoxin system VapC family toxin [Moorella sulfitireducens (nom. illeg.)]|uniref:type II toxin-antitoxin system VapC family toxin n=1 Tax=Neomoorella sulfitireducens TaxID=2972948 RepID=UPI0021AC725B